MSAWSLTGATPDQPVVADMGESDSDALSVSQAAELAAGALHGVPKITVLGEVTGFRGPNARSGHCYFQIKDESAALECIVWKGTYDKRAFDLRDGLQVLFTGTFDLYKPTGKMSFKASSFTLAGEGLLRQQVAQLAEKLRREGLMEPERKRRIPVFCTRVAVVTSLSGAVINDVKRTLRRRNPMVEVVCVGAKVQGEGAPAELVEGLRRAAAIAPAPDCILLVRGGGSFEDLMTFNDEGLARAVAACP
ncbi:MAG: exodeoxyribonuclease VII large subunit, partial [Collinsella intestinalis]